jgi:hypothetical protein
MTTSWKIEIGRRLQGDVDGASLKRDFIGGYQFAVGQNISASTGDEAIENNRYEAQMKLGSTNLRQNFSGRMQRNVPNYERLRLLGNRLMFDLRAFGVTASSIWQMTE